MRGELEDMSWPTPGPPSEKEDEAFEELAARLALKLAEPLADQIAERLADSPDDRPLLTINDVAARLNCSRRTANDLLLGENPRIPSVLVGAAGGGRRVFPADLEAYLDSVRGDGR